MKTTKILTVMLLANFMVATVFAQTDAAKTPKQGNTSKPVEKLPAKGETPSKTTQVKGTATSTTTTNASKTSAADANKNAQAKPAPKQPVSATPTNSAKPKPDPAPGSNTPK